MKRECQMILDRINRKPIDIPRDKTHEELAQWFEGYTACFTSIKKIIEDCGEEPVVRR